jgi:hypothetical protein
MSLFWRIVAVLEVSLNLHVCAAVNDGASPNQKFFVCIPSSPKKWIAMLCIKHQIFTVSTITIHFLFRRFPTFIEDRKELSLQLWVWKSKSPHVEGWEVCAIPTYRDRRPFPQ